jgi:hypothetical protein
LLVVFVLQALQLVSCRNVRNRDLFVLANNELHLTSLVLGDDTNKPWVTNRWGTVPWLPRQTLHAARTLSLAFLCYCHSLTFSALLLRLTACLPPYVRCLPAAPCRGIESIAKMTNLRVLALHDCNSITNKGVTFMQSLTGLHSLSLRGCRKLTNNGMLSIAVSCSTRDVACVVLLLHPAAATALSGSCLLHCSVMDVLS